MSRAVAASVASSGVRAWVLLEEGLQARLERRHPPLESIASNSKASEYWSSAPLNRRICSGARGSFWRREQA